MVTTMTFDTSWLAGEMNRAGLLSDNDHQDVIKVKTLLNDTEKAEIMLTSLKKKVALNSKHLSTFMEILILKPRLYSDAIDILKGKPLIDNFMYVVFKYNSIIKISGYWNTKKERDVSALMIIKVEYQLPMLNVRKPGQ